MSIEKKEFKIKQLSKKADRLVEELKISIEKYKEKIKKKRTKQEELKKYLFQGVKIAQLEHEIEMLEESIEDAEQSLRKMTYSKEDIVEILQLIDEVKTKTQNIEESEEKVKKQAILEGNDILGAGEMFPEWKFGKNDFFEIGETIESEEVEATIFGNLVKFLVTIGKTQFQGKTLDSELSIEIDYQESAQKLRKRLGAHSSPRLHGKFEEIAHRLAEDFCKANNLRPISHRSSSPVFFAELVKQ